MDNTIVESAVMNQHCRCPFGPEMMPCIIEAKDDVIGRGKLTQMRAHSLDAQVATGAAAPVPQFKMRRPPGIRSTPRPYSCDMVNLNTAPEYGNVPQPQDPITLELYDKSPARNTRLYERKTPSLVGRHAQHRMSHVPSTNLSPAKKALLARSSSQSELEQRFLSCSGLNRAGSSSSIEQENTGREETRRRAGTDTELKVHAVSDASVSPQNRVKPNDVASGAGLTPSSGLSAKQAPQPRGARSGESILRRLRFVGSRTASAITSTGLGSKDSSDTQTPSRDMPVGGLIVAPRAPTPMHCNMSCFLSKQVSIDSASPQTSETGDTVPGLFNLAEQSSLDGLNGPGDSRPAAPRSTAFHDCASLAAAWSLGLAPTTLAPPRPTGASQAQSPTEDDPGDGKSSILVASCQAFRNELGQEPVRRLALSRSTIGSSTGMAQNVSPTETWHREATAAEAGVLENLSNVYLGGRLCATRQAQVVIEPSDPGAYYYRHCFSGRAHQNFFGTDENLGPVAISLVKERLDEKEAKAAGMINTGLYRLIIRLSDLRTLRVSVPEDALPEGCVDKSSRGVIRELLELTCPQLNPSCLRLGLPVPRTEELLLKLDEQPIYTRYKVGVLLCRAGQSTEEQMYNNESSTPAFEEFLELLGQKVRLKGFEGYKGGLDTRGDTTGTHSFYAGYQQHQIMFHVSTMLPFTPSNRQQLSRKRHIGNDMVTVIFQEPGAQPFSPITVRSHFQHVFIVVRATESSTYTISVCRAKDVPPFGPPLPPSATFSKSMEFRDFLLTKIVNAENAVHHSKKFAAMAARTRREVLRDLAENHVTAHGSDGPTRIATRFLGGSVKRKEKWSPRPILNECLRGAISWEVEAEDFSRGQSVSCVLGLSADSLVLLQKPTGHVIFATPTHSIFGWESHSNTIKVYYDHGAVVVMRLSESNVDVKSIVTRLKAVTKGCEAQELILRRNTAGQLEFHIQDEGIVTDVEMYGCAWQAGLRQGSRLVELCRVAVSTLSLDQMRDLLKTSDTVRALAIPPSSDGSPRRGCEDPHCLAVKVEEQTLLSVSVQAGRPPPPTHPPGRLPPSYAELQRRIVSASPSAKTDQGYESGTWSREEHLERRSTVPDWNLSSLSSEERWRSVPPITDTMSSSGSASSEMSGEFAQAPKRYRTHRPTDLKRKERSRFTKSAFIAVNESHRYRSQPNMCSEMESAPPLPPRTYKNRMASASVHEHLLQLAIPSNKHLTRAFSEECLMDRPGSDSPPSDESCIHSARPAMITGQWNTSVVEAAARVLARNPTVASSQLRLQAALQRVRALEDRVETLTIDLEKERRSRQDLESEVLGLREDRRRLELERRAAEVELRRFTNWVCTAASPNRTSLEQDPGAC